MKIIDAHLHFRPDEEYFCDIAQAAGHQNNETHLKEQYERLGIACGVVMGNRGLELENHQYPGFLRYCVGLDSHYLEGNSIEDAAGLVEQHLCRESCVGIKLYPGYSPFYVTDPAYEPICRLAERYHKPVAIHTGVTASADARLKYSHPLTLDELAVRHPYVQFIMCHFGNPWLNDAAAVLSKNENVAADLSGLLEGQVDLDALFYEQEGYMEALRTWLGYLSYRNIMFGTDWPLVNLKQYIDFITWLVPEKHHENVFFGNANRIYQLGL